MLIVITRRSAAVAAVAAALAVGVWLGLAEVAVTGRRPGLFPAADPGPAASRSDAAPPVPGATAPEPTLKPVPYYRGPSTKPQMSLMVNVDWGDEFILDMLETLSRHGVSVTWFPTGRWAARAPELLKQIADAGHEIGNHGGWHGMASQMTAAEVERLIREGEEAVLRVTGRKTCLFAPPSGDMNDQTVEVAARMGYRTILWTIDTVDWQRPAASVIVDRVVRKAQNGALVLMHPTKPTAEALPVIIRRLREHGFELVTVSKLLEE